MLSNYPTRPQGCTMQKSLPLVAWVHLKIWRESLCFWLRTILIIAWEGFSPSTADSLQFDGSSISAIALQPISKRGHARNPAEDHSKIALRAEPGFEANVGQWLGRCREQNLRIRDPVAIQVSHERLPRHFLK